MSAMDLLGTIEASEDGRATVTFERAYDTEPADLWQAVTDPERLARWFAPVDGVFAPGGQFTICFDDEDAPDCTVLSCAAPNSFTWQWPHEDYVSEVDVRVEAAGSGALLRLIHTRLPADKAPEYGAGWQAFVRRLDAFMAGQDLTGDWWSEFDKVKGRYADALAGA